MIKIKPDDMTDMEFMATSGSQRKYKEDDICLFSKII